MKEFYLFETQNSLAPRRAERPGRARARTPKTVFFEEKRCAIGRSVAWGTISSSLFYHRAVTRCLARSARIARRTRPAGPARPGRPSRFGAPRPRQVCQGRCEGGGVTGAGLGPAPVTSPRQASMRPPVIDQRWASNQAVNPITLLGALTEF